MSSSSLRFTSLESFSNELLLDLFEYLPIVDLFRAFADINTRFNTLLIKCFRKYHLDFRSISKHDFDTISHQYLSHITDRVLSIYLSDDDTTPGQIRYYISSNIPIRYFTTLRSLTLSYLRSSGLLCKILTECYCSPCLNRLNFIDCNFNTDCEAVIHVVNDLWRLLHLTHCPMDISIDHRLLTIAPSTISTTLQSLSIESHLYSLNQLTCLLKHSPALRYLSISIQDDTSHRLSTFSLRHLFTLKFFVWDSSITTMMSLLKNSSNLRLLNVRTDQVNMNGYDWERTIVDHLPNLKIFQLRMIFRLNDNDDKKQRVDQLLDSFQTSFWLEKH